MAEILPTRPKTPSNQSINHLMDKFRYFEAENAKKKYIGRKSRYIKAL